MSVAEPQLSETPLEQLEARLLEALASGRAGLPVLPRSASLALQLANDPAASIEELAMLVDTDPPIAARFLAVANSLVFWRGHHTPSTHAAIVRLGLAYTRDLLFQAVYATSSQGLRRFTGEVQRVFQRSVVCAVAARIVARELTLPVEYDYMCGLLHDIGEARVYRVLSELPRVRIGKAQLRSLVARHHCQAGAEVAMTWRLPTEIVDACAAHHDPDAGASPPVLLVKIADLIARAIVDGEPTLALEPELSCFSIDRERAHRFIEETRRESKSLM